MTRPPALPPGPRVEALIRRTFGLARQARDHRNHPFGALLADAAGNVLLEAENTVVTGSDCTGHAELNLVRQASRDLDGDALTAATLYTSTEPCAMCAGAIYWAGVSCVVFGLRERELAALTGADLRNPTLVLPCREVFARGQRSIEVIGPLLEEEARAVHEGFWIALGAVGRPVLSEPTSRSEP
jgi:tRNA(Arg) A34 adenosine deaminase TadA